MLFLDEKKTPELCVDLPIWVSLSLSYFFVLF